MPSGGKWELDIEEDIEVKSKEGTGIWKISEALIETNRKSASESKYPLHTMPLTVPIHQNVSIINFKILEPNDIYSAGFFLTKSKKSFLVSVHIYFLFIHC